MVPTDRPDLDRARAYTRVVGAPAIRIGVTNTFYAIAMLFTIPITLRATQKALDYDTPVISAMALGVITASFGGMLADVMTGYRATIARQAHWIASALVVGAIVFVLVSLWVGFWPAVVVSVIATVVGVIVVVVLSSP